MWLCGDYSSSKTALQVPHGLLILPEILILCGLLSRGHRSRQEPAPLLGFPQAAASFRGLQCASLWISTGCGGDILPHHGLHHGLRKSICSSACSTLPPPPPFFFTDLGVCRDVSLTFFLFLSLQMLCNVFYLLLSMLLTRCWQCQ